LDFGFEDRRPKTEVGIRWRGFVIRAICSVVIRAIRTVAIWSCMFGPDYKSAPAR